MNSRIYKNKADIAFYFISIFFNVFLNLRLKNYQIDSKKNKISLVKFRFNI